MKRFPHPPAVIGIVVVATAAVLAGTFQPLRAQQSSWQCRPDGKVARVAELAEGSGLAASRTGSGRLWAHNDSGDPVLFALNPNGSVAGGLRVSGATVEDWEAVATGPCPSGSCIYIGDIGDNDEVRDHVTVFRIAEPADVKATVAVEGVFHATYPDGAHDAEALLAAPDGSLMIVTKGMNAPVAIYRFPRELKSGTTVRLERVGSPRAPASPSRADRVTDGSVSPDGQWVVLRSLTELTFYRVSDLTAGNWRAAGRVPLTTLDEAQGEGVAFGGDGTVYLLGEGGGGRRGGTFARLTCAYRAG